MRLLLAFFRLMRERNVALCAVDGDPTLDIAAVRQFRLVMQSGALIRTP